MASHPLRLLSLCSGYGGLDLAVKLVFPSAVTVCYVEREIPCARILAARMEDGSIDPAPIWDDVSTFDGTQWAGCVDLIVAGFPCQPHSLAGKREGTADSRWPVWDDIIRIARECSARVIFLENVPGLLTSSGGQSIAKVRADLDNAGYPVQAACVVGAGDVGASHRRDRLFILANTVGGNIRQQSGRICWQSGEGETIAGYAGKGVANAQHIGHQWSRQSWGWRNGSEDHSAAMGNPSNTRLQGHRRQRQLAGDSRQDTVARSSNGLECGIFAPGQDADWSAIDPRFWPATPVEPTLCGVANGTAGRVDLTRAQKIRALGNGVVPIQAALALRHLMEDER